MIADVFLFSVIYKRQSMKEKVRVASGQGFWGDLLSAPVEQVRGGAIDYLMLDYLAEVTMSILQKQKSRDASAGYARDFVSLMREILPDCVERNIKVTANAGGVNVEGCAAAVKEVAGDLGLSGKFKIGIVTGDDILPRLDEFLENGVEITNMETGESLADIRDKVQSANVYLGAKTAGRSARSRRSNRHRRTPHRYGFDARAAGSRIRLVI